MGPIAIDDVPSLVNSTTMPLSLPSSVHSHFPTSKVVARQKIGTHTSLAVSPKGDVVAAKATSRMIEQVEQHVPHRTPVAGLANPPRIGQAVPAQQPGQVGTASGVERHQLAVHQRPGW